MFSNRQVKVVFQPKDREKYNGKRRFGIGTRSIAKYVGESNEQAINKRVEKCTDDKIRIKFRKQGIVDIYFL